jgi:diacylglycerol kinase (ATP)
MSTLTPEVAALKSVGMVKRLANAVKYSLQGLKAGWQYEAAVRTEIIALGVMTPLAFATPLTGAQRAVLIGSVVLVLVVELLNSAVETCVDLASPGLHPLAGRAKDMGSAAVMLCVLGSAALWCWLAVPVWLQALGVL